MKPFFLSSVLAATLLASGAQAQALPAVPTVAPNDELASLQRTIAHHAHEERAQREWVGATGMAAGILGIVAGAGLSTSQQSDTSSLGYVVAGGGLGAFLGGGLSLSGLLRGDYEKLAEFTAAESKHASTRDATAARIKHEWEVRAADVESTRLVSGYAALATGAVLAGVGTYIALAPSARDGELRNLSPVLTGGGYLMGVVGAYSVAVPSSLESGREAYEASWPRVSPSLGLLPGGGAMNITGSF